MTLQAGLADESIGSGQISFLVFNPLKSLLSLRIVMNDIDCE